MANEEKKARTRHLWIQAFFALACIGAGLAWCVHPGAGVVAVGIALWVDLNIDDWKPKP